MSADYQLSMDVLRSGLGGIDRDFCSSAANAAIVCLASQGHVNGVPLHVTTSVGYHETSPTTAYTCELSWQEPDSNVWTTYGLTNFTTGLGAVAVAFLLIDHLSISPVRVSPPQKSFFDGKFDYWVAPTSLHDDSGPLFQSYLRLEISGISSSSERIGDRILAKLKQLGAPSGRLELGEIPAIIVVVGFVKPCSMIVKLTK